MARGFRFGGAGGDEPRTTRYDIVVGGIVSSVYNIEGSYTQGDGYIQIQRTGSDTALTISDLNMTDMSVITMVAKLSSSSYQGAISCGGISQTFRNTSYAQITLDVTSIVGTQDITVHLGSTSITCDISDIIVQESRATRALYSQGNLQTSIICNGLRPSWSSNAQTGGTYSNTGGQLILSPTAGSSSFFTDEIDLTLAKSITLTVDSSTISSSNLLGCVTTMVDKYNTSIASYTAGVQVGTQDMDVSSVTGTYRFVIWSGVAGTVSISNLTINY